MDKQLTFPDFLDPDLSELLLEQQRLTTFTRAENTQKGYACEWAIFERWCQQAGLRALPANEQTVLLYLTDMLRQGRKISTVQRHKSSINHVHRMAGLSPPKSEQIRRLITGVQRLRGEHPAAKSALEFRDLQRICATLDNINPYQLRTRAMLTLGFASALRRSNLVALELRDLEFTEEGLLVTVRREKQDQKAYGRTIGVPRAKDPDVCAVCAVQRWLEFRGEAAGPLFVRITDGQPVIVGLNPRNVAKAIKKCVAAIGLSPAEYSGHSLRAGLITEAFERGLGEIIIAAHTGHRSLGSLRRYFRRRDPFRANAYALLGL